MESGRRLFKLAPLLVFAAILAQQAFASSGAMLLQFASRATLTPQASVYGSFVIVNPTNLYIAVRGPSLQTLGVSANAHPHPSLGLYNSAGVLVASSNQCSGSTPDNAAVVNYYSQVRGAPLSANDACLGFVSSALPAGVYSFMITPDSSTPNSSGEVLFETTPGVTGATSSPTGSLSDLYGTMTLKYGFGTSRNYVDQVQFSSVNLTTSSGTPGLVGNITGSTRQIACVQMTTPYQFGCYGTNPSGAHDFWAFSISSNWAISGIWEYCLAGVSNSQCGADAAYSPDGGVIGSISGPGKSPTSIDGQIPSKNVQSVKDNSGESVQHDEKELAKAQPQPSLDVMEIQKAVELLNSALTQ